ncbi:MAG: prephenate dehydrogenase/arogenate dehydrogenase family protein [Agriterribacter sp.]
MHAAYVSHISHITSFALANTVLEKEKEEDAIFELAGGGFESTVATCQKQPCHVVAYF